MKRVFYLITAFLVCLIMLPLQAFAADSSILPDDMPELCNQESWEVLALSNKLRIANGALPITTFGTLQQAANIRADELVTYYSHSRPDYSSCFTVFDDVGLRYYSAGENIAAGYTSPASVTDGWYNSSGHRANMLNTNFYHGGMGFNSNYWVQLFMSAGCSVTDMELILPEDGCVITLGHEVEDSGAAVALNCSVHGWCYMPLISEMCTGADLENIGEYTVTASYGNLSEKFTLKVIDIITEGDFVAYADGGSAVIAMWTGKAYDEVVVPDTIGGYPVVGLGDSLFESATLTSVTLPNTIESIGDRCFAYSYIPEVVIPDGVKNVGEQAFYGSYLYRTGEIVIPASVENIGVYAFSYINRATNFVVDEDNMHYVSYEGVLYNKDMTTLINYPISKADESYVVPESVTLIYCTAFARQNNLIDLYVYSPSVRAMTYTFFDACFNVWCYEDTSLYTHVKNETGGSYCTAVPLPYFSISEEKDGLAVTLTDKYTNGWYLMAGYDENGRMVDVVTVSGVERNTCTMPLTAKKLIMYNLDENFVPTGKSKLLWEVE